jgi:hypothetical protein
MARLPRYAAPGMAQHIIQRGNNRVAIFAEKVRLSVLPRVSHDGEQRARMRRACVRPDDQSRAPARDAVVRVVDSARDAGRRQTLRASLQRRVWPERHALGGAIQSHASRRGPALPDVPAGRPPSTDAGRTVRCARTRSPKRCLPRSEMRPTAVGLWAAKRSVTSARNCLADASNLRREAAGPKQKDEIRI